MNYNKGDRVRHPTREDWGLGEVLGASNGKEVRVFFVGAGEKTLVLAHVQPVKVSGPDASHPILDNLQVKATASGIRYQSLPESIERFLSAYPGGFHGERFHHDERAYKEKAHRLAVELLGKDTLSGLLRDELYEEIVRNALSVSNATNLIFPNEKMGLKDGLEDAATQARFAVALYELLHGESGIEQRFTAFCKVLIEVGSAKWPVATYFPFFLQPGEHMFVKPTITQQAAQLCAFELSYRPQPNWQTYSLVLKLANYLFHELQELEPRDMIDVQSFMWCVAEHP